MQENVSEATPVYGAAASATAALAATPMPDEFQLPKLLIPRDPEEGKWLAGLKVPRSVDPVTRRHRLVNIMLLGSDEELTEDNFIRTDTMIVVSLNVDTGTVAMLSLPRDLFVYIPHGKMGRLNTAFGIGENLGWEPRARIRPVAANALLQSRHQCPLLRARELFRFRNSHRSPGRC